jgi:hypothetical protein
MASGLLWWHIRGMPKLHKSYRIVPQKNSTHGVLAVDGNAPPVMVTYFMTKAEAQEWIWQQQRADMRTAIERLRDAAKAIQ